MGIPVSVLGDDYPAGVIEKLQQRGVDLSGVHPLGRPGVRTWLLYENNVRRLIHHLGWCEYGGEVARALVSKAWRVCRLHSRSRFDGIRRSQRPLFQAANVSRRVLVFLSIADLPDGLTDRKHHRGVEPPHVCSSRTGQRLSSISNGQAVL